MDRGDWAEFHYQGEIEKIRSPFYDEFDSILLKILGVSSAVHGYLSAKGVPVMADCTLLGALYSPVAFRIYTGARMGVRAAGRLESLSKESPEIKGRLPVDSLLKAPMKKRKAGAGIMVGLESLVDSGIVAGFGYTAGYILGSLF